MTTKERLAIESHLAVRLGEQLGLDPRSIDIREPFSHYGLDSLQAAVLLADLGRWCAKKLAPTLVWEYPTVEALARYLADEAPAVSAPSSAPRAARPSADPSEEPIAVIGMACRFPQAPTISAFWNLLCSGKSAITTVPEHRWDAAALYDRDVFAAGKMNSRWGGFLDQVDRFDPLFFGISPKEAVQLDPQQRLMLELSWEALEDAGTPPDSLKGSRTGVYFGLMWLDYPMLIHDGGLAALTPHTTMGYFHSFAANRVSYTLGLQGPSLALDSACSSALVAVHLACQSLRRGETTAALVGGVNLNILPHSTVMVSKLGVLSPDGRCYTFDARANGYVRGEGGGVVVLKPLARALNDKDPIYCVIRGSAINNDGPSNGLRAPNPRAQEAMLRDAYASAFVDPAGVDYVELHGTGTPLGDPIEAAALGRVLGVRRPATRPLRVGSVKTNIGHLEAAAGIAGLIKVALCLKHRTLPPSLNYLSRNPNIAAELPLQVQQQLEPWPELAATQRATAGVSSFGLGGTNGHVVMQEAAPPRAELWTLSCESAAALRAAVQQQLARLPAPGNTLPGWCHDTSSSPGPRPFRLAMAVRTPAALRQTLQSYLTTGAAPGLLLTPPELSTADQLAFVFSGQGAQWAGMGRSLLQQEPVFRAQLARCDQLIAQHLGWSLIAELLTAPEARFTHIEFTWPALVALEIALAALLFSWGVTPSVVVGHSNGEVAAAQVAGVLTLEDAMQVACTQGRVMQQLHGRGAMGLVAVGWDAAARSIAGFAGRLHLGIQASPDTTVLTGEPAALAAVFSALGQQGVFCRRIHVDVAGHSPQLLPLETELFAGLRGVQPRAARIPIFSTATGKISDGAHFDAAYWVKQLSRPVYFADAITCLVAAGHKLFVEVAPHPIVGSGITATLQAAGQTGVVLATLRRDEDERAAVLGTLAALYVRGVPLAWPERGATLIEAASDSALPAYYLVPISARSAGALQELAQSYAALLSSESAARLQDVAYAASVRRSHHPHRLAVVAPSAAACRSALTTYGQTPAAPGLVVGRARVVRPARLVFVFSGQGSQWVGMGRQLLAAEPVFRAVIASCDAKVRHETGWSLLAELQADPAPTRLHRIDVVQPLLFAIAVALAALYRSWGIVPDAVVGHSMGEIAAAHVAGILSLGDAVRIICRRSMLMQKLSGRGVVAQVELSLVAARALLVGESPQLAVAASNGPQSTAISGEKDAMETLLAHLTRDGIRFRRVPVDVAAHSPQMELLRDELMAALAELQPAAPQLIMYSTVTAAAVGNVALDAAYWFRNLREPVLLWPTLEHLRECGYEVVVELSPHPILLPALQEGRWARGESAGMLGTLRREQPEQRCLLETLAELYVRGHAVHWASLHHAGAQHVTLPSYPWQRERYWVEEVSQVSQVSQVPGSAAPRQRSRPHPSATAEHPLLGAEFSVATQPATHFWEQRLDLKMLPWLREHRVQQQGVFPGSGYLEMALAAARRVYGAAAIVLEDVQFQRMLTFTNKESPVVQTALTADGPGASFQVASQHGTGWTCHAVGRVTPAAPTADLTHDSLAELQQRCFTTRQPSYYQQLADAGIEYGPHFHAVANLWVGTDEALVALRLPEVLIAAAGEYIIHPAWLDAHLHAALSLVTPLSPGAWVPVAIARLQLHRPPAPEVWVHVRTMSNAQTAQAEDIQMYGLRVFDGAGQLALEVQGLRLQRLHVGAAPRPHGPDELLWELQWQSQALPRARALSAPAEGAWLILASRHEVGAQVLHALRQRGERCIVAGVGARFQKLDGDGYQLDPGDPLGYSSLLRDAFAQTPCKGVVHLWSLDSTPATQTTLATLEQDQQLGAWSATYLVQALDRTGWRNLPALWLVTSDVVPVGPHATDCGVAAATLWGLGKVIAIEHPELACHRIDLGSQHADAQLDAQLDAVIDELFASSGESEVALRDSQRYVSRLIRCTAAAAAPTLSLRRDCSYLITGGLGGLGLATAQWLVAQGARHLVLVGRSAPTDSARGVIATLEAVGVTVTTARVDVANNAQLAQLLAQAGERFPLLGGIIHAAAALDDALLVDLTTERFQRGLSAKAWGAWNLATLTQHLPLDFFICYSSVVSVLGAAGQGSYVAANAFVDALAHDQKRRGRRMLSINWGLFADLGLAAVRDNRGRRLSRRGMQSLTLEEGQRIFLQQLGTPHSQVVAMKLDARQWVEFYPDLAAAPFWAALLNETAPAGVGSAPLTLPWLDTLRGAVPAERAALLESQLTRQLGQVLRLAVTHIDPQRPFSELGLDSLMSLEMRNLLEASLGLQLPAVTLLTYANLHTLARYLLQRLDLAEEGASAARQPAASIIADPAHRDLDQLSESELLLLLEREVALAKRGGSP